jgi:hypothetical protein
MKRPSWASRVAMGSDADLGSLQKACALPASCAYNDSDANLLAVAQTVGQPTRTVRDMSDLAHAPDATVAAVHGQRFCPDTEEVTGSNPVSPTSNIPGQRQLQHIASNACATYAQEGGRVEQTVGPCGLTTRSALVCVLTAPGPPRRKVSSALLTSVTVVLLASGRHNRNGHTAMRLFAEASRDWPGSERERERERERASGCKRLAWAGRPQVLQDFAPPPPGRPVFTLRSSAQGVHVHRTNIICAERASLASKSTRPAAHLAITQLRSPAAMSFLIAREHLVGAPSRNRILLVEEVLRVPPRDLITPQHSAAHFLP